MKMLFALCAAVLCSFAAASAATISSVSSLAFGPANVLFAADWKAGRVYAYRLPPAVSDADAPFNLLNLGRPMARAIGNEEFRIQGLAMRPGTAEAYISLQVGSNSAPAIVRVTPSGAVVKLDLAAMPATSIELQKFGGNATFWDRVPERAYTVTDMKWHEGHLYVSGVANQNFSSTLRVLSYPFRNQAMASIEMYHTVHAEWETRAPIRAMAFAKVNAVDTLLAGYLCSPLVAIPVASLVDGAHVKAKTLAELGVAGIPSSMLLYDQPDPQSGKSYPFVLVAERYRPSIAIPLAAIAKEAAGSGITSPPNMMAPPAANLGGIVQDFDGVLRIDNQDDGFFVALRRDLDTGSPQLVSYDKHASFRLSDADISEYDFPDYVYTGKFQTRVILPMQNVLKREEGYPDLVIPEPKP